jgi:hypothetical protein
MKGARAWPLIPVCSAKLATPFSHLSPGHMLDLQCEVNSVNTAVIFRQAAHKPGFGVTKQALDDS